MIYHNPPLLTDPLTTTPRGLHESAGAESDCGIDAVAAQGARRDRLSTSARLLETPRGTNIFDSLTTLDCHRHHYHH